MKILLIIFFRLFSDNFSSLIFQKKIDSFFLFIMLYCNVLKVPQLLQSFASSLCNKFKRNGSFCELDAEIAFKLKTQ